MPGYAGAESHHRTTKESVGGMNLNLLVYAGVAILIYFLFIKKVTK